MTEYKKILKDNGLTGKDMAELLGLEYGGYRSIISRGTDKGSPKWIKAFMLGYKIGKE